MFRIYLDYCGSFLQKYKIQLDKAEVQDEVSS